MNMRSIRRFLMCCLGVLCCMGMSGQQGCEPPPPETSNLEGLWSLSRGTIGIKISWDVSGGGDQQGEFSSGLLETLDPADYPEELAPLIDQWNAGIDELNANLDEAFPDQIVAAFPVYGVMKIYNPDDPTKNGTGAINSANEYFFLSDLSGAGAADDQGAGAILYAATIQGSFDSDALTTQGKLARTLLVLAEDEASSLSLKAEITVEYAGEWTGEVPENVAEHIAAEQTLGG